MSWRGASPPRFIADSRFEILGPLGEGGMGLVYEAYDREHDSKVALKTLPQMKAHSAEAVLRFKNEFRALHDLQHRNLVSLGELFEEHGQWFFSMELIDGVDLMTHVRGRREDDAATDPTAASGSDLDPAGEAAPRTPGLLPPRFDERKLRDALAQLTTGLAALHAAGMVHRDIKPSNIMVARDGRLILLDFGLVTDETGSHVTEESLVGTAAFMAPEQAASGRPTPAADWYSVGAVLYEILTGSVPFTGKAMQVLLEKQKREPPPPESLVPGLPRDLCELCSALLRRDPEARPRLHHIARVLGGELPSATSTTSFQGSVFVGRDAELGTLDAAFASVAAGARIVLLHGESGVGKTALVRQFRDRLGVCHADLIVLAGRCYERETAQYKAFDGVLEALAHELGRIPPAELRPMLPYHAGLLPVVFPVLRRVELLSRQRAPAETSDPQELRMRVFGALRQLIAAFAERRPVLVVIDDLQWADADSLGLLGKLMAQPGPPRLLLLCTVRDADSGADDPEARWRPVFPSGAEHVRLRPLSPDDARELAQRWLNELGGRGVDPALITGEAAGHPLFIAELARHSVRAAPGTSAGTVKLDEAIWSRVTQLDRTAQQLLALISVAARPLPRKVLARAAEVEAAALSQALAALRIGQLVRTGRELGAETFEPFHDKIRVTVLGHVGAEPRRQLHERIAVGLETLGSADAHTLAVHWREAGDDAKAAEHFERAADQAAAALAFEQAASFYRLALELRPLEGEAHRQLRRRLGDALANAGLGAQAAREYLAGVDGAPASEALELQRLAAVQLLICGHIDEGRACIAKVLESVGMRLAPTPNRALVSLLARRAHLRLRGLRFREQDATQIAGAELALVDICWSVSMGLSIVDPIRGSDFQTLGLLLALRAGETYRIARAVAMELAFVSTVGRPAQARVEQLGQRSYELADRLKLPHVTGLSRLTRGMAALLNGQWRDSYELCREAEQVFRDECRGVTWEIATGQLFWMGALSWLGEVKTLREQWRVLVEQTRDRGNLYAETNIRTRFSDFAFLSVDRPEEARRHVVEALARWTPEGFHVQHYYAIHSLGNVAVYAGVDDETWAKIDGLERSMKVSLQSRIQFLRVEYTYLHGRAALSRATGADSATWLKIVRRDVRRLRGEKMGYAAALADLLDAGLARRGGRDEDAVRLLRLAIAGLDAANMALIAAAARRGLGPIVGGDEGRALTATADGWFEAQAVRDPERMAAMMAPGLA